MPDKAETGKERCTIPNAAGFECGTRGPPSDPRLTATSSFEHNMQRLATST